MLAFSSLFAGCALDTQCDVGEQECNNNKKGIGILNVCADGFWHNDQKLTCPKDASCKESLEKDEKPSCGECQTGTTKCEDDEEFECIGGMWSEEGRKCAKGCSVNRKYCED